MRSTTFVCVALAATMLCSGASAADDKGVFRFGVGWVMPSGDVKEPLSLTGQDLGDGTMLAFDGTLGLEPQDMTALTLGYEYLFTDRIGLDFILMVATADVDGTLDGTYFINDSMTGALLETGPLNETAKFGDFDYMPLTVGPNFHLTREAKVDLYVGPFVGYTLYGDLKSAGEKVSIKDDFAYGATLGIDVPVGKGRWLFNGAVRYTVTAAEIDEQGAPSIDVDPLSIQVAAGYRF